MGNARSPFWKRALFALVRHREARGTGLYTICAIVVALYGLSVLFGILAEDQSPRLLAPALLLSLLLAVILVQMWYQTVLGWLLVLAEFAVAAIGLSYFLLAERRLEPWPLFIVAVLVAISAGLVWNRPTRA